MSDGDQGSKDGSSGRGSPARGGLGQVEWLRPPSSTTSQSATSQSGPRAVLPTVVSFNRLELREIMNLYGRMVAAGEWRDYAMDFNSDKAVFSIFRRTSEMPLYRIEKDPKLARKQGLYSVVAPMGLILRRGHDLAKVIAVIDRKIKLVAG